jgi:hypothetical protein
VPTRIFRVSKGLVWSSEVTRSRLARLISFSRRFSSACDRLRRLVRSEIDNSRSLTIVEQAGSSHRYDEDPRTSFAALSATEIAVSNISEQWMTCRAVSCMCSKLRFSNASSVARVFSKSRTTSLHDQTALSKLSTMWSISIACRENGPCPYCVTSPAKSSFPMLSWRSAGTSKHSITRPFCGFQLLAKPSFSQWYANDGSVGREDEAPCLTRNRKHVAMDEPWLFVD